MSAESSTAIIDFDRSLRRALGRLLRLSGFAVRTNEGAESSPDGAATAPGSPSLYLA
jgi:hypothetical protein